MRIAIVDDERQDCATLSEMLAERLSQTAFIDVYDSGNHFLDSEVHYDLVFLDIVMDGLDGIETARRLREWDMGCLIVFLTSSSEYAWDAFPVHPFDYLLKPIDKARLARVLDEAERAVQRRERTLSLKVGRQVEWVNVSAVSYVNARDHYVYVGLTDGREIKCYMPFGEIQTMLGEEARFLACNRGVLINMDEVRSFDGECFVMNGAQRFPIRLSEKMPIRERFYQYIFRKTRGVE